MPKKPVRPTPKLKSFREWGLEWSTARERDPINPKYHIGRWNAIGTLILEVLELRKRVKQLELQQSKETNVL